MKKILLFILIAFMLIVTTIFSLAYEPVVQDDVNLTLCSDYTILSQSSATIEYKEFCGLDSCTYTTGNWAIDCSQNCSIDVNTDVGGNNITFNGSGTITINGNITNWAKTRIQNACVVSQGTSGLRQ